MSLSIAWLDVDIAKVFHFSDDRMERVVLHLDTDWPESSDVLAGHLANSKQILILAPGDFGQAVMARIQARFPDIAKRIVGCETLHVADDAAVAECAVRYFRKPLKRTV